jgi:hypothetical protein
LKIYGKKFLTLFFIITAISFHWYGCSQEESERKTAPFLVVTYNFLDNLRKAQIITENTDYVKLAKTEFAINNDKREVLFEHPNSEVIFKDVPMNEEAELEFGIGINPPAWDKSGDGVLFEITIIDEKSQKNVIFSRYIDPKNKEEHRKWFDNNIDLKAFTGQKVTFIFRTTGGSKGNRAYDWAGWGDPRILLRNFLDRRSSGHVYEVSE